MKIPDEEKSPDHAALAREQPGITPWVITKC